MTKKLPSSCLTVIAEYLKRPTPYFRQKQKTGLFQKRYLIGKGSPSETARHQTGVDCSGLVSHVIQSSKSLITVIKPIQTNLLKNLLFYLRPIENTNVKTLISPINSIPVHQTYLPGDLVHIGDNHVLIVCKVTDQKLYLAHASENDGFVTTTTISLTNPNKILKYQNWQDQFYYQQFISTPGSGVKRLRHWL